MAGHEITVRQLGKADQRARLGYRCTRRWVTELDLVAALSPQDANQLTRGSSPFRRSRLFTEMRDQ